MRPLRGRQIRLLAGGIGAPEQGPDLGELDALEASPQGAPQVDEHRGRHVLELDRVGRRLVGDGGAGLGAELLRQQVRKVGDLAVDAQVEAEARHRTLQPEADRGDAPALDQGRRQARHPVYLEEVLAEHTPQRASDPTGQVVHPPVLLDRVEDEVAREHARAVQRRAAAPCLPGTRAVPGEGSPPAEADAGLVLRQQHHVRDEVFGAGADQLFLQGQDLGPGQAAGAHGQRRGMAEATGRTTGARA